MAPKERKKASAVPARRTSVSVWSQSLPLFVGILLLVLGVLAGFFLHAVFFSGSTPTPVSGPKPLEIRFLFHPDCKLCAEPSSFELLLANRKVDVEPNRVDVTSPKGSALVSQFAIDSFPTVLVDANALVKSDPALFATLSSHFRLSEGVLVLPEKDLILQTKVLTSFMLKEVPPGISCTLSENKALVWEFGDLFEKATFDAFSYTEKLWTDLGDDVNYEFKYWTFSALESERAAIADACSKPSGVFNAFHKILLEKKHLFFLPIDSPAEYQNAAGQAGLSDMNAFLGCVNRQDPRPQVAFQMGSDSKLAKSYGLFQIPAYVIDCRFVVLNPAKLKESVCRQHPDFGACEGV